MFLEAGEGKNLLQWKKERTPLPLGQQPKAVQCPPPGQGCHAACMPEQVCAFPLPPCHFPSLKGVCEERIGRSCSQPHSHCPTAPAPCLPACLPASLQPCLPARRRNFPAAPLPCCQNAMEEHMPCHKKAMALLTHASGILPFPQGMREEMRGGERERGGERSVHLSHLNEPGHSPCMCVCVTVPETCPPLTITVSGNGSSLAL